MDTLIQWLFSPSNYQVYVPYRVYYSQYILVEVLTRMKHARVKLIRDFFGATMVDMKALTKEDMGQLGSAIARQLNIAPEDCDFEHVPY